MKSLDQVLQETADVAEPRKLVRDINDFAQLIGAKSILEDGDNLDHAVNEICKAEDEEWLRIAQAKLDEAKEYQEVRPRNGSTKDADKLKQKNRKAAKAARKARKRK